MNDNLGVIYVLTEEEIKIFIEILLRDPNSNHTAFTLVLLKELNYDFAKFMRVVSVGFKTKVLLQKTFLNKVLSTIREAVVIKDLEFKNKLDDTTITQLSRSSRYISLEISRAFIYQTIHKHKLDVLN